MAKLVDALVSGTSVSNDVQVRVLFWAQKESKEYSERSTEHEQYALDSERRALSRNCPGGEIGRHASLRGWCSQGCASSSLVLGTQKKP